MSILGLEPPKHSEVNGSVCKTAVYTLTEDVGISDMISPLKLIL